MTIRVIIAGAFGYGAEKLRLFLRSARESGVDARIVLMKEPADEAFLHAVRSWYPDCHVWTPRRWRRHEWGRRLARRPLRGAALSLGFGRTWRRHPSWRVRLSDWAPCLLHVMLARFFYAREYLQTHAAGDAQVLLSDTRDVVFQADPFVHVGETLINGVESALVRDSIWNSQWVYRLYDDEATLRMLLPQAVLCAGVTLGPAQQVVRYLTAMTEEICEKIERVCLRSCLDQGMHNRILRGAPPAPLTLSENGEGCIATLAACRDLGLFGWDDEQGLLTRAGEVIPIVHQYDRHAELAAYYERRFLPSAGADDAEFRQPLTCEAMR
jgi:hypothetical protein